jgi:single-strand DNA-binding protein
MSTATVTVTGYVAMDPKVYWTSNGAPVVRLRVGSTPRRVDGDGKWHDLPASFFTVNCWRKIAVNVAASLHKGQPVIVRGRLRMRTWTDDGKARSAVEIEAESIGHDLAYGTTAYSKGVMPSWAEIWRRMAGGDVPGLPPAPDGGGGLPPGTEAPYAVPYGDGSYSGESFREREAGDEAMPDLTAPDPTVPDLAGAASTDPAGGFGSPAEMDADGSAVLEEAPF